MFTIIVQVEPNMVCKTGLQDTLTPSLILIHSISDHLDINDNNKIKQDITYNQMTINCCIQKNKDKHNATILWYIVLKPCFTVIHLSPITFSVEAFYWLMFYSHTFFCVGILVVFQDLLVNESPCTFLMFCLLRYMQFCIKRRKLQIRDYSFSGWKFF